MVTCLDCKTVKRYLARKNYVLWSEKGKVNINENTSQTESKESKEEIVQVKK